MSGANSERLRREFGCSPATDEDWASPEFDHISPPPRGRTVAPLEELQDQWRQRRPYLIQHIRDFTRDPKWDPRGRVIELHRKGAGA